MWVLLADYDIDGKKLCPTALAFRDWWIRTIALMPKEWCLRLGRILQRDLFANFSESWHLFHGIVFPSISVYILERRKSGFTEPSIILTELLEDVFLPDTIYYSEPCQHLRDVAIDATCWNNDVWSFPKEFLGGESANLVFLLNREEGCSYNKAGEIVNQMVMDKCKDLELAAEELREYCKTHQITTTQKVAVENYISSCKNWLRGSHTFSAQSSRFEIMV